jgi:hypothetical protein
MSTKTVHIVADLPYSTYRTLPQFPVKAYQKMKEKREQRGYAAGTR